MNSKSKKTLVFGASANRERYSFRAIHMLREYGHELEAIGGRSGEVAGTAIRTGHPEIKDIDTITLYLGENRQRDHYNYLLGLKPNRIIFNPGAENYELAHLASEQGVEVLNACTLVMLRTGQY